MSKDRRNFDITANHILPGQRDYINHKQRDPELVAFLHQAPSGTLNALKQHQGLEAGRRWLPGLEGDSRTEAGLTLAATLFNTARYLIDTNGKMRNVLKLPIIANDETGWRMDEATAFGTAYQLLNNCANVSRRVLELTIQKSPERRVAAQQLGRLLGTTSLHLVAVEMIPMAQGQRAFDAQDILRNECLALVDTSRRMGEELGVYPSATQLAEPTSPLAVHILKTADNTSYNAYQTAMTEVLAA